MDLMAVYIRWGQVLSGQIMRIRWLISASLTMRARKPFGWLMCCIIRAGKPGKSRISSGLSNFIIKLSKSIPITSKLSSIGDLHSIRLDKSIEPYPIILMHLKLSRIMHSAIIIWESAWIKRTYLKKQ